MTNFSDPLPWRKCLSYKNYIFGLSFVLTVFFVQNSFAARSVKPKAAVASPAASANAPVAASTAAGDPVEGEKLFKANCTSCHKIDGILVGPALRDVTKKESSEWLHKWIKNNDALRGSGDKDAMAIYNQFHQTAMTQFTSFSDQDITNILAYISQESAKPLPGAGSPSGQPGGVTSTDPYVSILLWIIVIILGVAALILNRNINALGKLVREKTGEPIVERIPIYKNKKFITLVSILVVIFIGYTSVDNAVRAGHEQGYQPDQPIKFPHSVHAGINGINCLYCHAGAEKGRTAMIPSPNICMNCHKAIQSGTNTGTTEIAKIYYAVGWDPNKMQYTGETHPIHWVKIHNLPAHVYFNHSQHVIVGKLACQTCHGQIQDMDQVYQYATLSMGWCVNCHRTTPVQFTTNKYYTSMFPKLDEELKSGKIKQVTVADLGGTECQRCHY